MKCSSWNLLDMDQSCWASWLVSGITCSIFLTPTWGQSPWRVPEELAGEPMSLAGLILGSIFPNTSRPLWIGDQHVRDCSRLKNWGLLTNCKTAGQSDNTYPAVKRLNRRRAPRRLARSLRCSQRTPFYIFYEGSLLEGIENSARFSTTVVGCKEQKPHV